MQEKHIADTKGRGEINMTWEDTIRKGDIGLEFNVEEVGNYLLEILNRKLPPLDEQGLYGYSEEQQASIKKLRRLFSD